MYNTFIAHINITQITLTICLKINRLR